MRFLSRFRVMTKVMAVAFVVPLMATALMLLTAHGIGTLRTVTADMKVASDGAVESARLSIHAAMLNGYEFRLAGNPSPRTIEIAKGQIEREFAGFQEHLDKVRAAASPQEAELLRNMDGLIADYRRELAITIRIAEEVAGTTDPEQLRRIQREAEVSLDVIGRLRLAVRAASGHFTERMVMLSQELETKRAWLMQTLAIVATVGSAAGLVFGYFVGKRGIADPLATTRMTLKHISDGHFPADIPGDERKDEIGDLSRAVGALRKREADSERDLERRPIRAVENV